MPSISSRFMLNVPMFRSVAAPALIAAAAMALSACGTTGQSATHHHHRAPIYATVNERTPVPPAPVAPPVVETPAPAPVPATVQNSPNAARACPKPGQPDVLSTSRTATGMIIEDLKRGEGMPCLPNANVKFHTLGWVIGASQPFDDSREVRAASEHRPEWKGEPLEANLRDLLPGMRDGLIGLQQGGKRRLHIPSPAAFGARGLIVGDTVVVPPSTDVVYEIELVELKQKLVPMNAPAERPVEKAVDSPVSKPAAK